MYNQSLFNQSLECSGGLKRLLLRKGKPVTFFQLIQVYKMTQEVLSVSEAFQPFISKNGGRNLHWFEWESESRF